MNKDYIIKVDKPKQEEEEEIWGLSHQAIGAILSAIQNSVWAGLRNENYDATKVMHDFEFVWSDDEKDPGLRVRNPPTYEKPTEEELRKIIKKQGIKL